MAGLVIISTFFGFFWSRLLYQQVKSTTKAGESVTKLLFQFLAEEEKNVLNHLIKKDGETTQAEITRMEGMNKVKAFRTIKKLEEKNILTIKPHGKVRIITLREDLKELLKH
jgi:uncharacterized membrane protein